MPIFRKVDVVIFGAGISGLASAHFLQKRGLTVAVLETEARSGGAIRTDHQDGFLVESGPNSSLDTSPVIHELFDDLGILPEMRYANQAAQNRYILRDGKLQALPLGAGKFLTTGLFSTAAKLRLLREPFIAPADPESEESIADFVIRRLGREFLDYAINPFVAGVYAGRPEKLSVRAAFPKLHALEQKYGSLIKGTVLGARERKKQKEVSKQSARLFSFVNGMQTMTDALAGRLEEDLFLNCQFEEIGRSDSGFEVCFTDGQETYRIRGSALLLTIPAHAYSRLPGNLFTALLPALEQIEYPPVSMVFFGYRDNPANRPLDGFGYLIPETENRKILGTIWSSTIFPGRAPQGGTAFTTFVGGSRQPRLALLPEEELKALVQSELRSLLGIRRAPDLAVVRTWPRAIPQYNLGHLNIIEQIEEFEKEHPGIYLSGNFRGGIAVGDCIKQAKLFAEKISATLPIPIPEELAELE